MQRKFWWSALALFSAGCVSAWGFGVYWDHHSTLKEAQHQLESRALLLEQHAGRAFEAGDTLLQGVVEIAAGVSLSDPAAAEALFSQLNRLKGDSPQISSAWVMDADGVTIAESWTHPPATQGSFSHRQYFQAHLAGERGLHIGPLAVGGSSGRPRFTLSRGLFDQTGGFLGVAAAGVFSEYFSELYSRAGPGSGARLSLTRRDGAVLAEWPPDAPDEAGDVLMAERVLPEYPIRIRVSRPQSKVLAPWRMRSALTGSVALAAIAAFAALTALGLRTAHQERQSRRQLVDANERLEERVEDRTAALGLAHTRLKSLLATAGAGSFVWQLPDGEVHGDAGMAKLFELPSDEVARSPSEIYLSRIHPEDRPDVEAKVAALLAGETRYDDEYRVILPDGRVRWCIARGTVDQNRLFSGAVFEVTELKNAEARAAENEARLQLVADSAPALISYVDRDGRYGFVNRAYEKWFGVPRSEIVGRHISEVLGEKAFCTVGPRVEAALRGESVNFDAEVPYESGGIRHVEAEFVPSRGVDGSTDGFFGFVTDVTQRKRDEAALLEASARTQALAAERIAVLGQLSEGVIVTDDSGKIVFVNEAAARIHGTSIVDIPPEEFSRNYSLFTLDGFPYPSDELPLARAVLKKETITDDHWLIRRPDGQEVVAIGSARPVYTDDGRFIGGVLTLRDDTARRAAEEALAASERQLNAVLNNTRMAVFMMDERQHCSYMNAAAEKLTGYRFEETQGRPLHDVVHHTYPDGRPFPIEECAIDRAFPENHQTEGEEVFVHKDGHFYPVAYTASPIHDAAARAIGTIIELRDIRVEKENAERLQLLIGELNHRVKNTLATVQSIAQQALRGQDVPARVREAIVSRLIALSRSHDLLTRQEWGNADLRDIIRQALQPFGMADARAGRFVLDGGSIMLRPKAALALAMAFHELATNAVKYGALSNDGGRVLLGWQQNDGNLHLTWQETGGPPVKEPSNKGFGSRLIERGLAYELDGDVILKYEPDGLRYEIVFPLKTTTEEVST
ncbi:PAS domain S-box protein [Jannaschia formosa]|uniref:PAS domain S-box protein n=1 Tax=Jannaschia formosa TaxID=2259592 RepID=UPI00142FBE57|nr:PAS domain S-box protein [Jannaschia formosa]